MRRDDYERWIEIVDRDVAGEPLSEDERVFAERFPEQHPAARIEWQLIRELGELDAAVDELRARRIVNGALRVVGETPNVRRRIGARALGWLVAGLAAAAAVAVFFVDHGKRPDAQPPSATLLRAAGHVAVDGERAIQGVRVTEGAVIDVKQGVACIGIATDIVSCFGAGARLRVTSVESPQRRLDLLSGTVVSALGHQPDGHRFSVVAAGRWSTAVGTAFSVDLKVASAVETAVYEGAVRVGGETSGRIVPTHKLGLAVGSSVEISPVTEAPDSPSWRALQELTGLRFSAPNVAEPSAVTAAPAQPVENGPEPLPTGPRAERTASPRQAPASSGGEQAPASQAQSSAAALLDVARTLRREQRWAEAAEQYRRVFREFPDSAEGLAVRVSLGELELSHLGEPTKALRSFEEYLKTGGPLSAEARLGRIRALRALAATEEAAAIREFLRLHPRSLEAPALRVRLGELAPGSAAPERQNEAYPEFGSSNRRD